MEARELRLSFGGGMGDGDDMAGVEKRGRSGRGERARWWPRKQSQRLQGRPGCYTRAGRNRGMPRQQEGSMWRASVLRLVVQGRDMGAVGSSRHPARWSGAQQDAMAATVATTRQLARYHPAITLPLHTTMATNPPQLFLLADHIKLSLLERQRAVSLNLPSHSQDSQISRSLEQLRSGIEALESQVEDTADEYACPAHRQAAAQTMC